MRCSGLKSIEIPNSVISIGCYAFNYCSGLTNLTIGNSVASIENSAFSCSNLTSVTCLASTPPVLTFNNFGVPFNMETYTTGTLYVPYGSVSAYSESNGWDRFVNIRGLGDLDGDGELNVGDVTNLIDEILAGNVNYEDNPAADVNGDGEISIADITDLIDQLLNASN